MNVRDYAAESAEINAVVAGDTLPKAFLRTAAANPGVVALRRMVGESRRRVGGDDVPAAARPGRRCGGGVAGRRPAAGPADGADDAQPARVPCRRPRGDVPAGDAGLHLQLVVGGGAAVPRRPRRGGDRGRRGRRVPRAVLEGARRAPPAASHLRHRPAGRRHARRRGALRRLALFRQGGPGGARRGHRSGRPCHADLHLRHDGAAEGRDDQPAQRRPHVRAADPLLRVRAGRRPGRGVAVHLVPADGPHRRADLVPLQRDAPRVHDHVLSGPSADRHLRPRGPP